MITETNEIKKNVVFFYSYYFIDIIYSNVQPFWYSQYIAIKSDISEYISVLTILQLFQRITDVSNQLCFALRMYNISYNVYTTRL